MDASRFVVRRMEEAKMDEGMREKIQIAVVVVYWALMLFVGPIILRLYVLYLGWAWSLI